MKADPDKIAAITALRPPETKTELKTFLGMVNYLQRFIPRLAENTAPLRALDKKDVQFTWDSSHQECFDNVKSLVADDLLLAYYDRKKEATLQCDYSTQGIGVALVQEGRPIQFASKALIDGEKDLARSKERCSAWYTESKNSITIYTVESLQYNVITNH